MQQAGFGTLWEMLQHFPRDYSTPVQEYPWTVNEEDKQLVSVYGTVAHMQHRSARGKFILDMELEDVHLADGTPLSAGAPCCSCLQPASLHVCWSSPRASQPCQMVASRS